MKTAILLGSLTCAAVAGLAFANSSTESNAPVATAVVQGEAKAATGSIKVKVLWEGERPEAPKPLEISAEASKGCCPDGSAVDSMNPSRQIDKDGAISNVVLTIGIKDMPVKVPEGAKYELDQHKCTFTPHVLVVPKGATVTYKNSDGVSHNVHVFATKNKEQNNSVAAGSSATQVFDKDEAVKVGCDIHSWMSAYVYVSDDPIYGLTGADGTATLTGVPAGTYKVNFWHEDKSIGKGKSDEVVVEAGKTAEVTIKVSADSKGKKKR